MKKIILLSLLGIAAIAFAADNVASNAGVVRYMKSIRWTTSRVGAIANSGSLNTTNVLSTASAVVGKVIFLPGALTDYVTVYNATSGAGCSNANKVFYTQATAGYQGNSPTMGNSPTTLTLPFPYVFDLDIPCTSGITVISTRVTSTPTANESIVLWDYVR